MAARKPWYVKEIQLHGKGREAQEQAQTVVTNEFMNTSIEKSFWYRLMVNYATGTGKGKAAIETAAEFYDKVSRKQVFIGCFTEKQRDILWPTQLAEWGRLHPIIENNRRECYASFRKIKGQHFGLVILDEAHRLSEGDWEFFEHNTFEGVLVLTATEPRNPDKKKLLRRLTYGRRLIIKNDSAVKAEILNDFKVHVMWIELDNTRHYKIFKNTNTLYTDQTGYLKMCGLYTQAKGSGNAIRIRFAGLNRMRFVGNTLTKERAAIYVQNQIRAKGHRFVTIAASIAQTSKLGSYVCHSKSTKEHYNLFRHNKIDELISVNQLKEGENFDNLGRMVVVQVDGNPNDFEQLKGRAQRLQPGEVSVIYIIAARGTMDETWVRKSLENTPPDKIKHYNLDREKYWPLKDHLQL